MPKVKVKRQLDIAKRLDRIEKLLSSQPMETRKDIEERSEQEQKLWDEHIEAILHYTGKKKGGGVSE